MVTKRFDSAEPNKCEYCTRAVQRNDELVVIGTRFTLLIYHRNCDAMARAERVQLYQEFLRAQEPMRKENL